MAALEHPNRWMLEVLGTPARLEIRDAQGRVLLEGGDIRQARAETLQDGRIAVSFRLTDEGAVTFAQATAENLGKTLGIYLDDELISAPTVGSVISGGTGYIDGILSLDEARRLALLIESGALPLELTQLEGTTK